MVAIQIAASFVMWVSGYGRIAETSMFGRRVILRNAVSIIVLIVLGVVLTVNLRQGVSKLLFESNVRQSLGRALKSYPGSYLDEVRFSPDLGKTLIRAVVRGPAPFSPQEVGEMEDQLRNAPNGSRPELRLRYIHTTVVTRDGLLDDPESDTRVDGTKQE
jgi:hypothetical protein